MSISHRHASGLAGKAAVLGTGGLRGSRLATVALLGVFLALAAPRSTFAADGPVKLALTPVGQPGPFFDLVMKPGQTRTFKIDIVNVNDLALVARTYAADVYTIINGGFGGRLRSEPQTDTTRWLDYPTDVLELRAGEAIRRSFTVAVPAAATPGEYITSLVLENDQPIQGDGSVSLNQIIRQAVAVVVTVPGPRHPALVVGDATYKLVADRAVVAIAVENTGNVRLKPIVTFTLSDAKGVQVNRSSMTMDSFYAHTATFVELPLAALLSPGAYSVRLTLGDPAQDVRADEAAIGFVVEAPAQPTPTDGAGRGLTEDIQAIVEGRASLPAWAIVGLGCIALASVVGAFALIARRRRGRTTSGR